MEAGGSGYYGNVKKKKEGGGGLRIWTHTQVAPDNSGLQIFGETHRQGLNLLDTPPGLTLSWSSCSGNLPPYPPKEISVSHLQLRPWVTYSPENMKGLETKKQAVYHSFGFMKASLQRKFMVST